MTQLPATRRFTVHEYHAMGRAGILHPDERVELIEGEVVPVPPIGSRHGGVVDRLNRLFVRAAGDNAIVRVQGAVRLSEYSEPQPDLALLRARDDFYTRAQPTGYDTLLLVEVSHTSASFDRNVKLPLYAAAGVPEVWLVDLEADAIEVYRVPEGSAYREQATYSGRDTVATTALEGLEVRVEDVLG
jgi:Uma2 family endonuclease